MFNSKNESKKTRQRSLSSASKKELNLPFPESNYRSKKLSISSVDSELHPIWSSASISSSKNTWKGSWKVDNKINTNRLISNRRAEIETEGGRSLVAVSYGPKGSFYLQFNDWSQAWDNIPQSLQLKLESRNRHLPPLNCLSISDSNNWLAVFADGSFATSEFILSPVLRNCLTNSDSQPRLFKFAPHDGWVLVLDDGSISYERIPSTLEQLLSRRSKLDAHICEIEISGYGAWFVRFRDGECEWEGLPTALEKLLISNIRKIRPDEEIVLTLSVCDGLSFFAIVGDGAEWVLTEPAPSLKQCLEFAFNDGDEKILLPESVIWHEMK